MNTQQNWARIERESFADTLVSVGPDAPTLCSGWNARDLAAHVVLRERRPDAAVGIMVPFLSNYTESVRKNLLSNDWSELVNRVKLGPPNWNPMGWSSLDNVVNLFEFFVHHEDVLRAAPNWQPRNLSVELCEALMDRLHDTAWLLWRRARVGVILTDGASSIVAKRPPKGAGIVTVSGSVADLVLRSYGRSEVNIDVDGARHDLELFALTDLNF
ncbi:MAG: TIGR03085 family protein [Actinobacteria bacterium]|nr:TIGR03085 family protein [Actinomycetota bacterium]